MDHVYNPHTDVLKGIKSFEPLQLFPWDEYFATMAETDFRAGRGEVGAVKSFFIRSIPFGGAFAFVGGITAALRTISELPFDHPEFRKGMLDMGHSVEFVNYLSAHKRLKIRLFAPPEGNLMFVNEPAITAIGPFPMVRLVEGIITEAVNSPSLFMTKWDRFNRAAYPNFTFEMSRRRAQDHGRVTIYSALAGTNFTSNSAMRQHFKFEVRGSMGHEYIQGLGGPAKAFDEWLTFNPDKPLGLVDTIQCMEVDYPAFLDAILKHKEAIKSADAPFWGPRNDSDDLARLSIEQYVYFFKHKLSEDPWFVEKFRILLTNELDEYAVTSIKSQILEAASLAGLDGQDILRRIIWAAGTRPGVCSDQPSNGGVMKLMESDGFACIKLAMNELGEPGVKTSIPGFNRSALIRNSNGEFQYVLIFPDDRYSIDVNGQMCIGSDRKRIDNLNLFNFGSGADQDTISDYTASYNQQLVFDAGSGGFVSDWNSPSISCVPQYIENQVKSLPWTMKRLEKPQIARVRVTQELFELRRDMIAQKVLLESQLS